MPPRSTPAICNPAMIRWARKTAFLSLEELSRRTKISQEKLDGFEQGAISPSFPQLSALSRTLKRAIPAFYLPTPPTSEVDDIEFRSLSALEQEVADQLKSLTRRVDSQRKKVLKACIDKSSLSPSAIDECSIVFDDDYQRIASELRLLIGVSLETQFGWKKPDVALRNWKNAIEKMKIFIVQNDPSSERIPAEIFRGFVLPRRPYPVIVLNSKDANNGKIFTLIHELVHIAYINSIKTNSTSKKYRTKQYLEIVCNKVAAEFLCPQDSVFDYLKTHKFITKEKFIDENSLKTVAMHYAVSQEMMLIRLNSLNIISDHCYQLLSGKLKKAAEDAARERGQIVIPYDIIAVNKNGRAMTSLVIRALGKQKIDAIDASSCLGIRSKHIESVKLRLLSHIS